MKFLSNSLLIIVAITSCTAFRKPPEKSHGFIVQKNPTEQKRIEARILEASLTRGKDLYQINCSGCHGENGKGPGVEARKQNLRPADLAKLAREVPNFTFFISVSQWSGQMPGWKERYSELEREDLVNYIKTFAKN